MEASQQRRRESIRTWGDETKERLQDKGAKQTPQSNQQPCEAARICTEQWVVTALYSAEIETETDPNTHHP
ncbi:hypothetical protein FA13DRAFT_1737334 [Coprinellus micaceus]|uniref:Uncharacterized protein n=1 Tax=Coprinellus micaceus TaxID=71717 RepID=A0A4Y7SVP2_COPMI|nr:hypothetical protein FA13DRAFT_1738105 [Coprinellus micaceus]TEB26405.1 hypothetical protein FA13DRAFT_1737334 [Coprinellus micaceus]